MKHSLLSSIKPKSDTEILLLLIYFANICMKLIPHFKMVLLREHIVYIITTSTKALLFGSVLDIKFWSYVFQNAIIIRNSLPQWGQAAAPILFATGKKDNFTNLRIFGCQMWIHLPGVCKKRLLQRRESKRNFSWIYRKKKNIILIGSWFSMMKTLKLSCFLLMVSLMKVSIIFLSKISLPILNTFNASIVIAQILWYQCVHIIWT